MILKNRRYEKPEPSKDAKVFIILCEGKKREPDYFKYRSEAPLLRFARLKLRKKGQPRTGIYYAPNPSRATTPD
jgi:hypothetical protein